MPAPDERDRFGATPHDPDCHGCSHRWHLMPCEAEGCGCVDHQRPGLD